MVARPGVLGTPFPGQAARVGMDNDSLRWFKEAAIHAIKAVTDTTLFSSTAAGSPGTMVTHTLPANTLTQNTEGFAFEAFGTTAATANNKQIKVLLGATTIYDSAAAAANAKPWYVYGLLFRTSSSTATAHFFGQHNAVAVASQRTLLTGLDFTAALSLIVQYVAATADNDAVYDASMLHLVDQIGQTGALTGM